jgi:hypothetical protein
VLEPIGKLCSYWPEINNAVSKRHKKVSRCYSILRLVAHDGAVAGLRCSEVEGPKVDRQAFRGQQQAPKSTSTAPPSGTVLTMSTQAEQESDQAREIFEAIDGQLRSELPVILDLRIPFLDPSFECMVRMQSHFVSDGCEYLCGVSCFPSLTTNPDEKLGGVQRYFPEGVREAYAAGELDAQVCRPPFRRVDSLLT